MISSILHKPEDGKVLWSFNGTGGINNLLKDFALTVSALTLALIQSKTQTPSRQKLAAILCAFFTVVILLFGVEHFFFANYTPGIPSWSFVSFWIPWRFFWGYATGAFMVLTALAILAKKRHMLRQLRSDLYYSQWQY